MKKLKYSILPMSLAFFLSAKSYGIEDLPYYVELDKNHSEVEIIINKRDNRYDMPEISGEVYNMPWRNDKDFLKAKEKYNTHTLIAGFCAVLKNPLPGEEYNVSLASK